MLDSTVSVRPPSSGLSRRVPVHLSIERPNGKRRRVDVSIERVPVDDDRSLMAKASAEFRRKYGCADRIVAIYVTHS